MRTINTVEMVRDFDRQTEYAKKFGVWLINNKVCFSVRRGNIDWYEIGGSIRGYLATMDELVEKFNRELYADSIKK